MSGDAKVRSSVHGHFGDELKHSSAVGITHREDLGGGTDLDGPKPVFFFAPDRLRKRTADWGPEGLNEHIGEAWSPYVEWTRGWLRVEHGSGEDDVERIYRELLDGKSDPAVGHVLSTYVRISHPGLFSRRRPRRLRLGIGRRADSYRSHPGCDHQSSPRPRASPRPPAADPTSPRPAPHAHARFWHGYGSVHASPFTASSGAESCHFESSGGGPDVVVELDSAPQPYVRMDREQVEFWQNVEWSHEAARAAPEPITSLGLGGYWFPLQSRLLTTDGVRLNTIKVDRRAHPARAARKSLAARLAHVYLGPPVKPPGY